MIGMIGMVAKCPAIGSIKSVNCRWNRFCFFLHLSLQLWAKQPLNEQLRTILNPLVSFAVEAQPHHNPTPTPIRGAPESSGVAGPGSQQYIYIAFFQSNTEYQLCGPDTYIAILWPWWWKLGTTTSDTSVQPCDVTRQHGGAFSRYGQQQHVGSCHSCNR